ncbi:MAG: VOC family protein [Actinomycetota bacterium]
MTDDFEPVRRLRPDDVLSEDQADPSVFTRAKDELMSTIAPDNAAANDPLTMPDVYPRLAYNDERAAVRYLADVFQLEEIREARVEHGDMMLAWLRVGTGVVMVGHASEDVHQISSPTAVGNSTVQMMIRVQNVDAHYEHAVARGANITMPIENAFYGERRYEATDLEGHRWHFGEPLRDVEARSAAVSSSEAEMS